MPKKYYFVLKGYPRLSEAFISQEIYLLEQKGYDISILSMRQPREDHRQPINAKIKASVTYCPEYILKEPVEIFKGNFATFLKYPLRFLMYLSKALVTSFMEMDREHIKRFLQAGWAVDKCKLGLETYHLHSHFAHSPTTLVYYIHKLTGLKYSISAHAKDIYTISSSNLKDKVKECEFLTTCTHFNYDYIKKHTGYEDKIQLSYHGIDTSFFKPTAIECLHYKDPYLFCSVGRLVTKKGYDDILNALSIVKSKGVRFIYDIYGAGELESKIVEQLKALDLTGQVQLHGAANHPEIQQRFYKKGLFLCGSKVTNGGDRDGIPNTVAEAMGMELAIVATDVSGIPELVQNEKSGLLVKERDPQAMANAILFLINNPEVADQYSKAGRERVLEVFDANKCLDQLENCFQKFVEI